MIPKYRAWNKSTKEMYGDDDVVDVNIEKKEILVKTTSCKRLSYNFLGDVELMSSTGFTDNDGKDIFGGDIIDSTDGFLTGVVEFREALGMFVSNLVEYNNFERLCNVASSRKIIGNIWEHPELAEVKQ